MFKSPFKKYKETLLKSIEKVLRNLSKIVDQVKHGQREVGKSLFNGFKVQHMEVLEWLLLLDSKLLDPNCHILPMFSLNATDEKCFRIFLIKSYSQLLSPDCIALMPKHLNDKKSYEIFILGLENRDHTWTRCL